MVIVSMAMALPTAVMMRIQLLADRPDCLPVVAQWYFQQWGSKLAGRSLEQEQQRLSEYLQRDRIPLLLLGFEGDALVAAAQLKRHERIEIAEREYWLGGVYIAHSHRGAGRASTIVRQAQQQALQLGVSQLYLQTEADNGGLYRRLGWQPLEQRTHASGVIIRVMVHNLSASA